MACGAKLNSYQRLRNEEEFEPEILEFRQVKKAKAWLKFKALAGRRRPKVRIQGLRRFLRKRSRFLRRLRIRSFPWRKAFLKLKNGQSHWNDLFGGNFLFMHCNPTPTTIPHALHQSPSSTTTYPIGKIALVNQKLKCLASKSYWRKTPNFQLKGAIIRLEKHIIHPLVAMSLQIN
ncbi:Cytochrome P450 [Senna tora]|uniref:Cytochrome P450 n=1 Tax=Senna tora TaxID=362788 RepID=A0A834SM19_9FABA|nr:Cytochrome P450 [Senna tora]